MKQLTKPREGFSFWLWKILFHFNFARTWCWSEDIKDKRNTYFVGLHLVERAGGEGQMLYALSVILGPLKITTGYSR